MSKPVLVKKMKLTASYNGKMWDVVEADWFTSSGCTELRPSWLKLERRVNDEDGEYCRTDEKSVSADNVSLYLQVIE